MPLRVIPVLDVKSGCAVHAVGGQRAHYRPVRSVLHDGSDPVGLARAYRDQLGLNELYVADLDAIEGRTPEGQWYDPLRSLGVALWVDAGIRDAGSIPAWLDDGGSTIVVGSETVGGPQTLAAVLDRAGAERIAFSLDLREGVPLCAPGAEWGTTSPAVLAETVLALGVRRLILLDLARVGRGQGPGTLSLLTHLARARPNIELIVGGGIAGPGDLEVLARTPASAVLVASALHDGRIGRPELKQSLELSAGHWWNEES